MTTDTERVIFEKLDTINEKVADTNVKLAAFMGGAKEWKKQCGDVHRVVMGNGNIGLRAKMWVVWGLLAGIYMVIVAAAATYFFGG